MKAGARGVWLAPGFPALDTPAPAGAMPVASLVRELDADMPAGAPLTVLVPPVIAVADAERPGVTRVVRWQVVPGRVAIATPRPPERLAIAIRAAPGVEGLHYLRAAVAALLSSDSVDVAPTSAPLPRTGVMIWWAPGDIPDAVWDWTARGGRLLVPSGANLPSGPVVTVWRDELAAPLAEAVGVRRGRIIRFTRPLVPAAMPVLLDAGFPESLGTLVRTAPLPPTRIAAQDYAPERVATNASAMEAPRDLQPWLAVALAVLFLLERWLATRRRRAPAP